MVKWGLAAAAVLLAVAGVLLYVGLADKSYDSADELFAAVENAGIDCGPIRPDTESLIAYEEAASCPYMTSDGREDSISVTIYTNDDQQGGAAILREQFEKGGFGGGGFLIEGDQWSVSLSDRTNAENLADALGGDLA